MVSARVAAEAVNELTLKPDQSERADHCSWSHCTFCLRGLLDLKGVGHEYRRLPSERIVADFFQVRSLGARSVTLADEDLLGANDARALSVVETFETLARSLGDPIAFDASATVHSIFSASRPRDLQLAREDLIRRLKLSGLRKIFLGVESGSDSQLKRYAKGHTRHEAQEAIRILRRHGVAVELGWIMFDPLCTLDEIHENVGFLLASDTADATSYLFNELRLQRDTHYQHLLDVHRQRSGSSDALYDTHFDRDTLSFRYSYADADVASLVKCAREWQDILRPIHYPLKNLTRYGVSGELSDHISEPRAILTDLRRNMCAALVSEIEILAGAGSRDSESMTSFVVSAAQRVVEWSETLPDYLKGIEIVHVLLEGARTAIAPTRRGENIQLTNRASNQDIR